MPEFKTGDKVRVRLDSTSPYKGRIGVVCRITKEPSGFLYVVKFEWQDLAPLSRFTEEDLEAVGEPARFGERNCMESLEKVLPDTNRNIREYVAWCTREFPVLMKQAIENGLTTKEPPQVSIFERGYPLLERLAKEIDGYLSFNPSQKELLSQLADYLEDPLYIEETTRGLSFLKIPIKREYYVTYFKGRTVRGRADLVIFDFYEGKNIGIEVDPLTIKSESALKLASARLDYKIFVLIGKVGVKEMAESLFTLTKFAPKDGWQNTLVVAKNRGFYLGYFETIPTTVVKGQIVMPFEAQ